MILEFSLHDEKEFEKKTILIAKFGELTDNTTSYILDPPLPCKQCNRFHKCTGHLGRISLFSRIVNPLFVDVLCKEITRICPICQKYNVSNEKGTKCCENRISPTRFPLKEINYEEMTSINYKKYKYKKSEYSFFYGNEWFSIDKMYEHIRNSDFSNSPELKNKLLRVFIKSIPVLPINMRPSFRDSNGIRFHHNITLLYRKILDLNTEYTTTGYPDYRSYSVIVFNLYKMILGLHESGDGPESKYYIKQMLSGETGIIRSMCLAKEQNFCLRSVIVPNIDLPLDTVYIPKEFTDQLIPFGYKPNDFVIINRQPTLQATFLLAVHSLPSDSDTIQINPLIASVFQASFERDEMNIFWLPGKASKEELATILNLSNNLRSYKDASLMIKFIQDTLTGLYNMTRDKDLVDPWMVKTIRERLNISKKQWIDFCKFYKSRMNTSKIPYSHLLSVLLPRTLSVKDKENDKMIVDRGILVGVINGDNQMLLLNAIIHYGNEHYLKFMWNVQQMVHEYNKTHTITISISDCILSDDLKNSCMSILNNIPDEEPSIPNLDVRILNQKRLPYQSSIKDDIIRNYYYLCELTKSVKNNLANIVNSGSEGSQDTIIQMLFSVGIQSVLPTTYYTKHSYFEGLTANELFIHSKTSRANSIFNILNDSSINHVQRQLGKLMEDVVTDEKGMVLDYNKRKFSQYPYYSNIQEIDDTFLEFAFSMSLRR